MTVLENGTITYTASVNNAPKSAFSVTLSNGVVINFAANSLLGASAPQPAQGDDPYQDGSTATVTIASTSANNYEALNILDTATVTINDTIDTTKVTLGEFIYKPGIAVTILASVSNAVTETDLVITLSNGATATIAVGQTTGEAKFTPLDNAVVTIVTTTGGDFEKLDITDTSIPFSQSGRSQGFWGSHTEAWDGITTVTNNAKYAKLVGTDLSAAEVNPLGNGDVLMGDINRDGSITGNEVGLLVTNAVAKSILNSAVGGDNRVAMLKQAIAGQLNINNQDVNPGKAWGTSQTGDKLAGDMITEAVQWLKSYGGAALSDGILNTTDYNTSKGKFFTDLTTAEANSFWNTSRDVDGTLANIQATGAGLKNVLEAFDTNKLVTSANGDLIAWNANQTDPEHIVTVVGVTSNSADAFWALAKFNMVVGLT